MMLLNEKSSLNDLSLAAWQERADVRRETIVMAGLWLFIGLVAAYDVYLSIKYQEMLRFTEMNPVGQWLLALDGGNVAIFMGCKVVGTLLVLGILQLMYFFRRRLALFVAGILAALQGALGLYLTFG